MTTFDTIANAYITAWNARDADRAQAVAAAFAPDATYTDPLADVSGRAAIAELIGGAQQQFAGWTFRLIGPVDGHHGQARFTWALGPDAAGEAPGRRFRRRHPRRRRADHERAGLPGPGARGRVSLTRPWPGSARGDPGDRSRCG